MKGRKYLLLAAAVLAALLGAYILGRYNPRESPEGDGLEYEDNVVVGELPGKSLKEIQAGLEQAVEDGMLTMSINATPSGSISRDGGMVNWMIENPPDQGKLIRVEVRLEATGGLVYDTGAIRPGNYVGEAALDTGLPAGEYPCIATFYGYRLGTEEFVGKAAAQINLVLLE